MTRQLTEDFVKEKMKDFGTVETVRKNRIRITTTPGRVREAITTARESLGCDRLITISVADNRRTFEMHYHLTGPHRTIVTITVELSRDAPEITTTSDILLPSGIYERQIHDLFGINFPGHPALKKIILNEDWPENEYPLRKDWKPDEKTFYGGIRTGGK